LWGLARRAPKETADLAATVDPAQRGYFLSTVLHAWGNEAPDEPLAWLGSQPAELVQDSASLFSILQTMSRNAPDRFESWFSTLPEGRLRTAAENVSAMKLIGSDRVDEALDLATKLLPQDTDGKLVLQIAGQAARRDLPATAAWLSRVPDGRLQQQAAQVIGMNWGDQDPNEGAAWVESLPAGDVRDHAIGGYASVVAYADPAAAGEWLDRIDNPRLKERLAGDAFRVWSAEDPIHARRFLHGLTGVSDDWKEQMLRRAR